jgi:glucosamine--fructose-6-phosphate aminotransferase (isomerizing)
MNYARLALAAVAATIFDAVYGFVVYGMTGHGAHAQALGALLATARDVFVVGCGTAGHAALAAQYLLARIAGRRVTFVSGSEFAYLRDFVAKGSLMVAFSQSGETIDVIEAARVAQERGARIAAVGSRVFRRAVEVCKCLDPLLTGGQLCVRPCTVP